MNLKYIYKAFDEFTDVQIFCEVESIEINGNPEDPVWIGKVMDKPCMLNMAEKRLLK